MPEDVPRPTVICDHEEGRVAREVLAVLPEIAELYQRGGRLVQIAQDSGAEVPGLIRQASAPRIRGLPKAILRRWISDRCELLRYNKESELVPAHPPDWLVETVIQDSGWLGVRHLEAVVQSPMFVRHGRIVSQEGYDPHSGLYIAYPDRFSDTPVPEKPRLALKLARDLGEFERETERALPPLRVKYKPRRRWLPVEEVQALLAQLQPARQLWVLVVLYTSARFSEARRLTWDAIDFKQSLVHIAGTKNGGADRFVPLNPELRNALLAARKSSGVVLKSWVSALRALKAACKRAWIEKATFNDLRRTYSSWLKQAGVESFVVAKLLGHTTTKMVELVYGYLSSDVFERSVEKLPSLTIGVPEKPAKAKKEKD